MNDWRIAMAVLVLATAACSKKEEEKIVVVPVAQPEPRAKAEVHVGDAYADVLDKLGKPNINSVTENSRVLIYDRVEVKIKDDVVVEVHDHR